MWRLRSIILELRRFRLAGGQHGSETWDAYIAPYPLSFCDVWVLARLYFYVCVPLCVCAPCTCRYPCSSEERVRSPGTRVTSDCGPPDMGAGNQTQVYCKGNHPLLTNEPSFQSLRHHFFFLFFLPFFLLFFKKKKLGVMVYAFKPSTQEVEADESFRV